MLCIRGTSHGPVSVSVSVCIHRRKLLLGPGAEAPHFYDHGARLYDEPPTFVT